jgi:hypothetical protein
MTDLHGKAGDGWYAVDLDGTLAKYSTWRGPLHIGKPIPVMVERVEKWLADGKDVRILTARVSPDKHKDAKMPAVSVAAIKAGIREWLREHVKGGEKITVITHSKDKEMLELWDDRAVQVVPNTGERADGAEKKATILNLRDPDTKKKFLKFLKRQDVVGHRTTAGKAVIEQGQVLSSKELQSKGLLENVEGGKVGKRVKSKGDAAKHTKADIFASQGGLLKEKSYGDTGILAVSRAAVSSPYLNEFTKEVVIPPTEAGTPRRLAIGKSGYVVAPRKKVELFEKIRPSLQYIPTEDVEGEVAKALYHPTFSKLEVLRRWAPALADGKAKAPL